MTGRYLVPTRMSVSLQRAGGGDAVTATNRVANHGSLRRPIRVLYVLNDAGGGASMSAYQLMQELKAREVEPYVVCYPSGSEQDLDRFRQICAAVRTVYMPRHTHPWREPVWMRPLIWGKRMVQSAFHVRPLLHIRRLIRSWQIDVVHTNTATQIDGALAAKVLGVPHVWHVREMIGRPYAFRYGLTPIKVARVLHALSDRVVANSYATAGRIQCSESSKKLVIMHNGIRLQDFGTEQAIRGGQDFRASWGVPNDSLVVGMVGAVGAPIKGHAKFIDLASEVKRRCPRTRFVICGGIPERDSAAFHYYRDLVRRGTRQGLSDALVFAGHVSNIPAMMHALDVLVHPVDGDSFGRVILEAMAAGTPVVRFDAGLVKEVDAPENTGVLVPPDRLEILADRVTELIKNRDRRSQLSALHRAEAMKRFSLDVQAERMRSLYDDILEERRPRFAATV